MCDDTGTTIKVIKRDGRVDNFNTKRPMTAVMKAAESVGMKVEEQQYVANVVVGKVIEKIDKDEIPVERIQDIVVEVLMERYPVIGQAYSAYRKQRDRVRQGNSEINKQIESLFMRNNPEIMNENANKDATVISTVRDYIAGIVSKNIALNQILPYDVADAHIRGLIHMHDLDYSPLGSYFNCCLIDLKGMLESGFTMGAAHITEPQSITTAGTIATQIVAQVASNIYGGNTIGDIDIVLAKYVDKSFDKHFHSAYEEFGDGHFEHIKEFTNIHDDEMLKSRYPNIWNFAMKRTVKETYDAMQCYEYQINTLNTSNGQTPFTTVGFGRGTDWAARLIQKSILEVRIAGLGEHHTTAVFPKLVFALEDGVNRNPGDPNYDIKQLALKCASLRMYPDVLNVEDNIKVTGDFKFPMGCRSYLSSWKNEEGEFVTHGRFNCGVVTVNLPRVALDCGGDIGAFWALLKERVELARRGLNVRLARLKRVQAKEAPILYMHGALGIRLQPDDYIYPHFIGNGRATISLGYIGIHETVKHLFGCEVTESEEATVFSHEVLQFLHDSCEQWKKETGLSFGVYGTPSESLCDRFCRLDKNEHGIVEGVTDHEYYTNSYHVDVRHQISPFEKLDFEQQYLQFTSGGNICYTEFPVMIHNLKALETVWDYTHKIGVQYYGTNTPIDKCFECGYNGEFTATDKGFECPKCGNHDSTKCNVTRRVCGYLGSPDARPFNHGKQTETINRVKHM